MNNGLTALVKRGNVLLNVSPEFVDKYIKQGYCQLDPVTRKVIREGRPTDFATCLEALSRQTKLVEEYKVAVAERDAQIKALEDELEALKAEKPKKKTSKKKSDEDTAEKAE